MCALNDTSSPPVVQPFSLLTLSEEFREWSLYSEFGCERYSSLATASARSSAFRGPSSNCVEHFDRNIPCIQQQSEIIFKGGQRNKRRTGHSM